MTYDISNWNAAGELVNFLVEKANEIAKKELADEIKDEGPNQDKDSNAAMSCDESNRQ